MFKSLKVQIKFYQVIKCFDNVITTESTTDYFSLIKIIRDYYCKLSLDLFLNIILDFVAWIALSSNSMTIKCELSRYRTTLCSITSFSLASHG